MFNGFRRSTFRLAQKELNFEIKSCFTFIWFNFTECYLSLVAFTWGFTIQLHNYTMGAENTQLHNGGWIYTITQWGLDLPITKWGLNLHNYTMGAAKFTQFNEGWNYTIAQWGLKLHNCTMGAEIIYLAYSIYEYVLVYSVNKYTFSVQFKRLRI